MGFSSQKSLEKENKMILLYLAVGAIVVMLLVLAFVPRNYLKDGGWSDSEINGVKKFFHTTKLSK